MRRHGWVFIAGLGPGLLGMQQCSCGEPPESRPALVELMAATRDEVCACADYACGRLAHATGNERKVEMLDAMDPEARRALLADAEVSAQLDALADETSACLNKLEAEREIPDSAAPEDEAEPAPRRRPDEG